LDGYVSSDAPAIVLVNSLIVKALNKAASDIHLEPLQEALRVRVRIDGLLYDEQPIELEHSLHVVSRIKVLALMDIAERRIPQDGKFSFIHNKRDIDIRVATFPSLYGEKIVMRILDRYQVALSLGSLGFTPSLLEEIEKLSTRAYGFFLVTGPTGSGKTTTLHAMLAAARSPFKNSVTLEDPIEYAIEGITQAQINPGIGFTFERGIRAVLRQDPDIIMVGEIRDRETVQVALQAALTGHFVLSTIHTNDAPSTIMRLLDMGIEPFLINAAVTGILSQRLARKLCTACRYQKELSSDELLLLEDLAISLTGAYTSTGCAACHGTGYKGRTGIFELLLMSHDIRALITKQPNFDALYAQARQQGMQPLLADAVLKVESGIISIAELVRVLM
jgi:type II secretory ATPase GspE/PulE/Tfp pilus assembly ATPase PilB-like protein